MTQNANGVVTNRQENTQLFSEGSLSVTFGQVGPKSNISLVYCLRLYGTYQLMIKCDLQTPQSL